MWLATKVNKKTRLVFLEIRMFKLLAISFLLICCLLPASISYGQYDSNYFPAPGTNFVMAKSKVFPQRKMTVRDLGNNVWDFSMFNPSEYDTIRLILPSKTRYGKRFPESNIAMVISPLKIEYLSIDSGRLYLTGLIGDFMENNIPVLLSFTDSLLYKNPHLAIDQEYSDTSATHFAAPYYHIPGTDSIKADIFYVRSGRVDASGELITPLGKYKVDREVIFVEKRVRGYKYSVFGWTPAAEYSLDKHYTFYRWYTKDNKLPIAEAYLNQQDLIEYVSYQYDSPLRLNFTGEDVSCKGGSNGEVDLTVIGGIPDYTYQWTNGATSQDLKGVKAGTYRVVVTDNRGRTISSYYTVSEPIIALQTRLDIDNVSCRGNKDGKVKLNIMGGKAPYDFAWSNDSANETMVNLPPGKIKYMVLDAGGCRIVDSIEITQPDKKLSCDFVEKHVACHDGNNGSAEVLPEGGTPPYRFVWDDGDTSRIKINMRAGLHKVSVYDLNNCNVSGTVTIKQPETAIEITKEIKQVSCFGGNDGSVELNVTGGKAPYQYFWSDSSTNKYLKGYPSGKYMVEIVDKNDCLVKENVEILQPTSALQMNYAKKDVNCFDGLDGEITVQVNGGSIPYQYNWSNGTDKSDLKKIGRGIYTIKISDKNQCTISESIEILSPDKALFADFEKSDVKCHHGNDGTIKLTIEGGTPDYSYLWSNKSTNKDLDGLKAGSYEVTITDKNQCTIKKDIEIIEPETLIEIAVEIIDVNCQGEKSGSVYLKIKGGKPAYDVEWSNGENSPSLIGVGAGKYTATITDGFECKKTEIVEVIEPHKLKTKSQTTNPDIGQQNGSIIVEIEGGTKPYAILWDDGQSTNEAKNLGEGIHEVQIKDSKDCILNEAVELKGK